MPRWTKSSALQPTRTKTTKTTARATTRGESSATGAPVSIRAGHLVSTAGALGTFGAVRRTTGLAAACAACGLQVHQVVVGLSPTTSGGPLTPTRSKLQDPRSVSFVWHY